MAPIISKKRTSIRAKTSTKPTLPTRSAPGPSSALPNSKRGKLVTKHSSFVSKIEKSSSGTKKRRRPNKQLVANLESLADALPDFDDDNTAGAEGTADGSGDAVIVGQAKIQRKSLKSRPGALKRKEKLQKQEMSRFNQNLVQMSAATGPDRWAALKNHVKNTVEQAPDFAPKK